jgi:DNA polymerase III epsilon subunit family exonuclease
MRVRREPGNRTRVRKKRGVGSPFAALQAAVEALPPTPAGGAQPSDATAVLAALDLSSCPFAVIDIETTGSAGAQDGVTEIALVQVLEGRVLRSWCSFVNPGRPIPPFVAGLTGITDQMVAGAPYLRDLFDHVVALIGDAIIVGHNVRFDAGFINRELLAHGRTPLTNPLVDTLALARQTIAEVANYKLGTLTRELGIGVERHHRALADATATAELLLHCIRKLEDCGVFTYGALLELLRPAPRARDTTSKTRPAAETQPAGSSVDCRP